jgi:hypothetical protein
MPLERGRHQRQTIPPLSNRQQVQLLRQAGLKQVGCFRLDPSSGRPVLDIRKSVHVPPKPGLYAFILGRG